MRTKLLKWSSFGPHFTQKSSVCPFFVITCWWWTGTNSQSSTSKALTRIQCKLGKQYFVIIVLGNLNLLALTQRWIFLLKQGHLSLLDFLFLVQLYLNQGVLCRNIGQEQLRVKQSFSARKTTKNSLFRFNSNGLLKWWKRRQNKVLCDTVQI